MARSGIKVYSLTVLKMNQKLIILLILFVVSPWGRPLRCKLPVERVAALVNKTVKLSKGFIRLPLAIAHEMLSDLHIEYGIYSDLFGGIFFTLFAGGVLHL